MRANDFRVLGIDPGLGGGFALLDGEGRLIDARPFPKRHRQKGGKTAVKATTLEIDGPALAHAFESMGPTHAFIEAVHGRPRQAGVFNFGFNTGIVHGCLYPLGCPIERVAPQVWKSLFGIRREGEEKKQDKKNEARRLAQTLYPYHADLFARVKDDGVAEATLIAIYGLGTLTSRVKDRSQQNEPDASPGPYFDPD